MSVYACNSGKHEENSDGAGMHARHLHTCSALCQAERDTEGAAEREAPDCMVFQTLSERNDCRRARQGLTVKGSDRYRLFV